MDKNDNMRKNLAEALDQITSVTDKAKEKTEIFAKWKVAHPEIEERLSEDFESIMGLTYTLLLDNPLFDAALLDNKFNEKVFLLLTAVFSIGYMKGWTGKEEDQILDQVKEA